MASPLSICMVSDDFLPAMTGVGTHVKLVAPELVRRGHRVCVITTRRKGEPALEQWEGVTIHRVFTAKAYGFYQGLPSVATVRAIFEREKPDLVHHHYVGFMMRQVCRVAESLQLRQVSTYHFGAEVLTQPLPMRPFRGLIRRLMVDFNNRFDLVIAPSKNLALQISRDGVRTPVRYITNPVQRPKADVLPAERTPGFTVLYAGRLGPEKNIGYLIKAFAALLKSVPDVIRYGYYVDETSALAGTHLAATHYLESWGDARTSDGTIVPVQPMIMPLFNGLMEVELIARLAGESSPEAYEQVYTTRGGDKKAFEKFLHDGLVAEQLEELRRAPGARPHIPADKDAPVEAFEAVASSFPVFRIVPDSAE